METNVYRISQQACADLGVDTEAALRRLASIPISLHCWQGDEVGGFEREVPFGAVWEEHSRRHDVLGGREWIDPVIGYESRRLSVRR